MAASGSGTKPEAEAPPAPEGYVSKMSVFDFCLFGGSVIGFPVASEVVLILLAMDSILWLFGSGLG